MIINRQFIRFAAVCCFLSVITTLGIHGFFPDPPSDFDDRIQLFRDPIYLLNRWWVIIHCLLVIISMWGFAQLQFKRTPGSTGLGFIFYCSFALAEICRQMFVFFYINGLREQFNNATDTAVRESIRASLTHAALLTAPLFGVFILMFALGGLCFGISLCRSDGFSRIIAIFLLISGVTNLAVLGNSFWRYEAFDLFMEKFNLVFTPMMRLLIGIWLWKKAAALPAGLQKSTA